MKIITKYWLGITLLILVVAASVMIYIKLNPKDLPSYLIEGSGRIDGDLVNLNTKYPGRLEEIFVEDGMPVTKGTIIAKLNSEEFKAQKRSVEREIEAKYKELEAYKTDLEISKVIIPQLLEKAKNSLKVKEAQKRELSQNIALQKALLAQDERDLKRLENLYSQNLIQKEMLEKGKLKYDIDLHKLEALQQKMLQIDEAIKIAKSDLRDAQATQKKIYVLKHNIEALKDGIKALEAKKDQIEAILAEMMLRSPIDGFIVEKIANTGEVVGTGMPIVTLIDPHTLYLKIFLDTIQNGKIKLHDKAVIFLDALPNYPIKAEVVRIAQKAEFTPKEVSVRSDRIQRVFAVYLKPLKVDPLLKLGIPAIGVISLNGKDLPKSLNEIPVQ
ncbi:HlyD family efflux transporter periplasmic adaptor subunit [Hydrogenimonas thermophila]|uniref:HlyD family secretion protein n=1 Tax=Hydrogenimonas thermophila TaxID=223786 RepID=UPI0029370886|nr:HlyD family efflux transporter periplasmic adaptor subunit [Hydrogenimonas thermophila]WOE70784.1 HlyD family efflux transporter periplasmic adaptor subunit [Hydrogenimonas thermophila]WOE73302.1 HlyD family efflux transporter periplasmic adaptor subunit [Hydrogenimonas thermophila]